MKKCLFACIVAAFGAVSSGTATADALAPNLPSGTAPSTTELGAAIEFLQKQESVCTETACSYEHRGPFTSTTSVAIEQLKLKSTWTRSGVVNTKLTVQKGDLTRRSLEISFFYIDTRADSLALYVATIKDDLTDGKISSSALKVHLIPREQVEPRSSQSKKAVEITHEKVLTLPATIEALSKDSAVLLYLMVVRSLYEKALKPDMSRQPVRPKKRMQG